MISMQVSKAAEILQATYYGLNASFLGCSTDTRTIKKKELFIALRGENFDGHHYIHKAKASGASAILSEEKNDGSIPSIIVKNTRQAMAELARSWRACFSIPLIAITGSNGKTTVKEMLATILNYRAPTLATPGNHNNDIGIPLTLFSLGDKHQYVVIEMGANHSGEIEYLSQITQPTIAVITQCAPAHLQGFSNIKGVAYAKAEIFTGLSQKGTAVINGDDEFADLWLRKSRPKDQLTFGFNSDNDVTAESIRLAIDKSFFAMVTPIGKLELVLNLPGKHNIINALAAATCAIKLGFELPIIKQGLEYISPIKGRLQIKIGPKKCRIIDDTYNANPISLLAALDVLSKFPGRRWLVIGDMGELGDEAEALHISVSQMSKQSGVERIYALGKLAKFSAKAFGKGAYYADDHKHLAALLNDDIDSDVTILIKGSRSMAMEQLLHFLNLEA